MLVRVSFSEHLTKYINVDLLLLLSKNYTSQESKENSGKFIVIATGFLSSSLLFYEGRVSLCSGLLVFRTKYVILLEEEDCIFIWSDCE